MKKCKNGHYYEDHFEECPYCPGGAKKVDTSEKPTDFAEENSFDKTKIFPGNDNSEEAMENNDKTKIFPSNEDANKTKVVTEKTNDKTKFFNNQVNIDETKEFVSSNRDLNKTYIGDFNESDFVTGKPKQRASRKLVGWLVSYTIDKMGIDFRLYEGKNFIGASPTADITIPNDKLVSGTHATIRFKNNIFKIKDEFSTNGTLINNVDTDDEVITLKDNDTIKIGSTIFKFRTAF